MARRQRDKTSRRVYFASAAIAAAFALYGLFIHLSQQRLLDDITSTELRNIQAYSDEREKEGAAQLHARAAAMSATVAKLAASQLENSQSFNLLKDGMASTLEPFMDYPEVAAIEVTDRDNRPYASMWKSAEGNVFRANYVMPPEFRSRYRFSVTTPSVASGATQGFVAIYIDDQAIAEQTAEVKRELQAVGSSQIEMLRGHFAGSLLPQLAVLLCGIVFVVFSGRTTARSYAVIEGHRRELEAFNLQLEDKVGARTAELEAAVAANLQVNGDLRASKEELLTTIEALRRKDADLQHLAFHDPLTDLPNRSLLVDRIGSSIALAFRQHERRAVIFVDLDRFKSINDSLGHEAGDALLKTCARRLSTSLRKSDSVARIGGDEFVVLLGDAPTPESYGHVAQVIAAALSEPMDLQGTVVEVGASLGIACFPQDGRDAEELLRHADMAMYEAKTAGGGRFCFYDGRMTDASLRRLQLESELRTAIASDQLVLYYQPKVSLRTHEIVGLEALVRWRHPTRGLLPPGEFVPVAEATDLITALGDWVLDAACRQAADWRARGFGAMRIAVNVSARQLQRWDLADRVSALIDQFGIHASDLELELTESVFMTDPDRTSQIFAALRGLGVVVAMDDFGTGYSSLGALRRLPIDVLKIDRSFTRNADRDADDAAIVRMIIGLAKTLELEVVAEGVETESQAAFLADCGCSTAQGFLYAKPCPAADVEPMLRAGVVREPGARVTLLHASELAS